MAKKLNEFPADYTRGRYDWNQWLDGSIWQLIRGEDFEIETASMRAAATREAKKRGLKVRTSVVRLDRDGEGLVVQAFREDG